jgi:uncharacterized Zn-binding protein involved in type VI secretion
MAEVDILTIGCTSTHGGVIITGDPTFVIGGKPAARIGDLHFCPQSYPGPVPHAITPIVKGPCGTIRPDSRGIQLAFATDKTGCGAILLSKDTGASCEC